MNMKEDKIHMKDRKKGMIRTWMDAAAAFSIVGITFELLENVAFGMNSDLISAVVRALGCAHFIFGTIMGWFYGKYLVTGQKKYRRLALWVPVLYHTLTNALMDSMSVSPVFRILGMGAGISHIVLTIVTVIVVLIWQKKNTLDVPVLQKQDPDAPFRPAAGSDKEI